MSGTLQAVFQNLRSFMTPSWLATIGDPDTVTPQPNIGDNTPHGSFLDSAGNLYVAGSSRGSSNSNTVPYVVKYDPSGVILWQYTYGSATLDGAGYSITGNSAGNIYLVSYSGGQGNLYTLNTSGDIVSQIGLSQNDPRGVLLDSNGEIIVLFESRFSFTAIARLNSAATSLIWNRSRNTNQNISFSTNAIAIANSGNIYVVGRYNFGGAGDQGFVAKYDSTGTIVWSRRGMGTYNAGIAIDSSENLYVCGQYLSTPTAKLNKIDSSGNFIWGKTIGVGCQAGTVAVDPTGSFIYVSGTRTSAYKGQYICKFDNSGTIQYQRTLQYSFPPGGNVQMAGPNMPIRLDSNFMYIAARADIGQYGSGEFVVEKLPLDGSKTGTYTLGGFTVTYAASSLTIGDTASSDLINTDYSGAAGSLTLPSSSNSRANVSLTASTTTL
jgi:hypothetical protein